MKTSKFVLLAIVALYSFVGIDTADAAMCTLDSNGCNSYCVFLWLLDGCQQQTYQAVGAGGCANVIPVTGQKCGVVTNAGLFSCPVLTIGCGGLRSSGACTPPT